MSCKLSLLNNFIHWIKHGRHETRLITVRDTQSLSCNNTEPVPHARTITRPGHQARLRLCFNMAAIIRVSQLPIRSADFHVRLQFRSSFFWKRRLRYHSLSILYDHQHLERLLRVRPEDHSVALTKVFHLRFVLSIRMGGWDYFSMSERSNT